MSLYKTMITLTSLLFTGALYASNCTPWQVNDSASCVFAGNNATLWTRSCEESETSCKNPRFSHAPCDNETMCVENGMNPNYLESTCTPWRIYPQTECITGTPLWVRSCQMAWIATESCSAKEPDSNL